MNKKKGTTMTEQSPIDVLIVGAGPVGLTLAISLARYHISFRIIDQALAPQKEVRAKSLTPRTEEIFEDLGVLEQIHARGQRNLPTRFYERERCIRAVDPASDPATHPTPDTPYRGIFWIGQNHTQAVLRERLAESHVPVEQNSQLVEVAQNAELVIAQVNHAGTSETIRARYLVGCDGGHSTVRHSGGFSFLGQALAGECYLNAGVSVSGLHPAYAHYWMSDPQGFVGFTPLRYDGLWAFQARLSSNESDLSLETCQRIFAERAGLPGVQMSDLRWASTHQPNSRMVNRYCNGRIFLAGDAAHVHSAAGGQGMNTGIGDAYNLGWKLAHVLQGAPDTLLDTYQTERLPLAQVVLASTTVRHQAYLHLGPDEDASRMRAFLDTAVGKDAIADTTQLSISYRGSSLARDLDDVTGIRAGDRAPDFPFIVAATGKQGRLFDLFRGPHFTLLAFGEQPVPRLPDAYKNIVHVYVITRGGSAPASSDSMLLDIDGYAHHFYGIQDSAMILVRPDNYIGLTGSKLNLQSIIDYLHTTIGR
jgi:2-polyprenyl-6-methoxyphenol hydroxylase-like FAD-dependent oxidoreductase